jgi:hypothetical protein
MSLDWVQDQVRRTTAVRTGFSISPSAWSTTQSIEAACPSHVAVDLLEMPPFAVLAWDPSTKPGRLRSPGAHAHPRREALNLNESYRLR